MTPTRFPTTLAALLLTLPAVGQTEAPQAESREAKTHVDGITISTHGSGRDWGTDVITDAMRDIDGVGANWVATHPYAWIRNHGAVEFRAFDPDNPPEHFVRPIREAKKHGLEIMIKPHLGYWGSKFSWRGEIDFEDKTERERFFTTYRRWIKSVARACKDADAFVVGTELDRMLDADQWRAIIADVRAETDAHLTYAANWTDYRNVEFWDALDVVGIQAYFPIAEEPTADEKVLRAGWKHRMKELRAYAEETERDIVFTELGYNRSFATAVEPWNHRMDGIEALTTQKVCLRVALEEVRRESRVVGAFLWKWFPRDTRDHDFKIQHRELRKVISDTWKRP